MDWQITFESALQELSIDGIAVEIRPKNSSNDALKFLLHVLLFLAASMMFWRGW